MDGASDRRGVVTGACHDVQWVEMETVLPTFLERSYGELVPTYSIVSLHFWGTSAVSASLPWLPTEPQDTLCPGA